jgi:hypothetical protein
MPTAGAEPKVNGGGVAHDMITNSNLADQLSQAIRSVELAIVHGDAESLESWSLAQDLSDLA